MVVSPGALLGWLGRCYRAVGVFVFNRAGYTWKQVDALERQAPQYLQEQKPARQFYDVDNDGWLDLIMVNGRVYPQLDQANLGIYFREPDQLFLNQRDGAFLDVSDKAGQALKVPRVGRGLASGDLFNDGIQEVIVENLEGQPTILRPKGIPRNHWISFELAGTTSNKLALNARIRLTAGELVQTDELRSGGSYLSQKDLRLHFGLGSHSIADKAEIFWPSGKRETLTGLAADRFYGVKEGTGALPCTALRPGSRPKP